MKLCVLDDPDWGGFDPSFYLAPHQCEMVTIRKATAVQTIQEISRRDFEVVLNFCDGAWDESRPGLEVVEALEHFQLPFTGADTHFYEPTREAMKLVCEYFGIYSPPSRLVSSTKNLEAEVRGLRYPLLTKHPNSYGSAGLVPASRVETFPALVKQAERMIQLYGGTLIEEFIDGREFSVLVSEDPDAPTEPKAYLPIEILFPPGETFKHEELKWVQYEQMRCLACQDAVLSARLQEMSRQLFVGLDGAGYARCDIRMNAQGELFMLEINPNAAVLYPPGQEGMSDYILNQDPAGHAGFMDLLLRSALGRHARRQDKWRTCFRAPLGFGMVANRPIAAGELIQKQEATPWHLVTLERATQALDGPERERFFASAFPVTEGIWAVPGRRRNGWLPLNHSCEPTAWLTGLDLVARCDIATGEAITIDYSTLFVDEMPTFQCACGAAQCRGTIEGGDYLKPFVSRYGEHLSPVVRERRARKNGHH